MGAQQLAILQVIAAHRVNCFCYQFLKCLIHKWLNYDVELYQAYHLRLFEVRKSLRSLRNLGKCAVFSDGAQQLPELTI